MPMDLTDGKSTLVQVMALCRHMASLGHNELIIGHSGRDKAP